MTSSELRERAFDLEAIMQEMLTLVDSARQLVRGTSEKERARSYWLAHIETALHKNYMFLGGSMVTMTDTIATLMDEADELEEMEKMCPPAIDPARFSLPSIGLDG